MTFRSIEISDAGPSVRGTTKIGREAAITLCLAGGATRFDVSVSPIDGTIDERSADIELGRAIADADAISHRLAAVFGTGDLSGRFSDAELLRGAASLLDGREVEPELIEALLAYAEARPASPAA